MSVRRTASPAFLLSWLLAACPSPGSADDDPGPGDEGAAEGATEAAPPPRDDLEVAIFAGGCFWCMEGPFEAIDGVGQVLSGYAGGQERGPSYREVASGNTGHTEAVRVLYDPDRVGYDRLLEVFWHNVDPFDGDGQFCDRGRQYRPAIFPVDDAQRQAARRSLQQVKERFDRDVAVTIEDHDAFWIAEAYHQDFYRTNRAHYQRYRQGCGRDARLQEVWGQSAGH